MSPELGVTDPVSGNIVSKVGYYDWYSIYTRRDKTSLFLWLNGMINLGKKIFEHEVKFSCWYKATNGWWKGLKDAWRLDVIHVEYEILKIQERQQ